MELHIGMIQNVKELVLELDAKADTDKVRADIEAQLAAGGMIWLTDRKGRQVAVPVDKLAYVEITSSSDSAIGFGA